jgi:DNA-binding transcriptional MerR regulator
MLDKKSKRMSANQELPAIPNKLYFTIGEVSKLCNLKTHVLRYWEQEFPQLNPSKRRGNRRCYQKKDILLVREIISLLYEQGFTIEGARTKLSQGKEQNAASKVQSYLLHEMLLNLEDILNELEKAF